MRASRRLLLGAPLVVLLGSSSVLAAPKPALETAQDLFRRNRWEEARKLIRSRTASIPQKDQAAATFLIGRSYVREAEFYREARRVGVEVGLAYLKELSAQRGNKGVALIPAFTAFYQLEAGDARAAERGLAGAVALQALAPEWQASAKIRRAAVLERLGSAPRAAATLGQPAIETRFWKLLQTGSADASVLQPGTRRERLLAAALLFRGGRAAAAESLVSGLDLDAPDAQSSTDPKKVLRFHDPLVATAWERICWERATLVLRPQAISGSGVEQALAAYYTGLSLFELGALPEAGRFLKQASESTLLPQLQPSARLLLAACSWRGRVPPPSELLPLWDATSTQPETVLLWAELARPELAKSEPFASKLDARSHGLLQTGAERPNGALVGRWGLLRLQRGEDPGALLATLSEQRDDSNKNKIDWNDPLLLLALAAANHRGQQYAQSLETLFELSKSFPGLRWLQWNLQGIYAARQKAGGEIRISQ